MKWLTFLVLVSSATALTVGTACAQDSDCVPDADCTGPAGSLTCQCPHSLVPSFNDTKCRLKVDTVCNSSIANVCIANAECNAAADINNTVCQCRDKYSMYKDNSLCSGDVGAACDDPSDCTVHGQCRPSGTCACMDLYKSSIDNKTCLGYVGAECDDVSQCIEHAVCNGGTCKCSKDYEGDKLCEEEDKLPLPLWAIVLIAVGGGLLLIGLIVLIIWCCCCRNRH